MFISKYFNCLTSSESTVYNTLFYIITHRALMLSSLMICFACRPCGNFETCNAYLIAKRVELLIIFIPCYTSKKRSYQNDSYLSIERSFQGKYIRLICWFSSVNICVHSIYDEVLIIIWRLHLIMLRFDFLEVFILFPPFRKRCKELMPHFTTWLTSSTKCTRNE